MGEDVGGKSVGQVKLTKDIKTMLDISISLTGEKDYNLLLGKILKASMDITASGGGTLYLLTEQGLEAMISENRSEGFRRTDNGASVSVPAELSEKNICAYCALHRKAVNIKAVYDDQTFDFEGLKEADKRNGYHTGSMLVLPLISHEGEVLGVLQLMNAADEKGKPVPYDEVCEYLVLSIVSQAAVSLDNLKHMESMKELLDSMVAAFTRAIDERTPYNANHTTNVACAAEGFLRFLNRKQENRETDYIFDQTQKEQIVMAARLHDVGKLVIPLEIMNKASRLGEGGLEVIKRRFELIAAYMEIDCLKGGTTKMQYEDGKAYLRKAYGMIEKADEIGDLADDTMEELSRIGAMAYRTGEGVSLPYLTEGERNNLSIQRGTLTEEERKIMENHVVMTTSILNEIKFGAKYDQVREFAGAHHEYLDGSGYPNGLKGEEVLRGARILTILDIFDSLVSRDRPYKKPMPVKQALSVLKEMAAEGKLDDRLVQLFCEYGETYETKGK